MVKYFSGLVTEPDVSGLSDFGKFKSALDITNNLKKIRDFYVFFEDNN